MISKWNYLPLTSEERKIEAQLETRFPKCPAIARLLVQRGVKTWDQAQDFFYPQLSQMHDPFLMRDMDKAVNRLNKALGAKEKIMIYGDYDVDGTTAVALVYRYLQNFYSNMVYYVPTRDDEGYGISIQSIDYAASIGVKLIIVLDCGIKAIGEISYAKSKGIDFIVCDHHVPDDELPPAVAILNPKLKDDKYPFKELSGCGVGFKFMQGFAKSNGITNFYDLESLLDLCVVSIAADIVPIVGENRIMACYGLKRLNSNPNVGLRSIIKLCGLSNKELTISDIIFKIGPRINASGRMESGTESVELLVTKDSAAAYEISKRIDKYNKDRKELDRQITEEANKIIESHKNQIKGKKPIVIYDRNWHKGIIGIVASRLAELYFRPSVVLTYDDNGLATGSSRSVRGFNIYAAIKSTRDLLETFGGHTNAVGLSLKEENIDEFRRRLTDYVEKHIETDQITPQIDVDCELGFEEINNDFLKYLRLFNPFGPDNPKPVFVTKNVYDFGTSKIVGKKMEHIKFELVDSKSEEIMNGIAFNMATYFDYIKQHKPFDICYTVEENKHRNSSSVQLQIKGIRIHGDQAAGDGHAS
ncbi:single-stranded-DNA-specific exonuclease RecJ [Sodaliphilus pleomorphus]|jgi:single-stranded-DNA-specific exonuclease|uniref:Single-stranded-DNA-specific exonuclease RecJ n=1 Tax=Sodaliphilus pleomorphus TaxID=2606626 RepID=A0A6L5X9Y5_9BACT|nr:single-stranded-DNA-specific exonuclease RecJ [Sodaliphilus pleomorphus]MCI5980220.1 single-stranded-DNA-specific exonuclease RecJ [Muribaculaceae bacterium]MDY6259634.1 single-stranded-DNA-specific exonuclease RecJ [Bacteroidales bacterium]MCI6169421.1 single-stranded-DNA-specific exonuclease RecJ [Muribaculaceae bacterium]MDD6474632.1 single-stranded-DNA-specific exonuclease RecJ [Sodaliphilus pleomorphus]MSS17219.1 single-stranded-DNA-specific exonuclease RecJ [Sodaliphilus pleomorphus]